ncbi:MAG: N-formylglutamate deformylase [Nevskia sp.]
MTDKALHLLIRGEGPLLINVPHAGTYVPADLLATMTPQAQTMPDTDWHVPFLYQHALPLGATLMAATHSRYVVDLNRDPENAALYPGADNTELCPLRTFANEPIHRPGCAPDADAVNARRERYWRPYHAELAAEIATIRERNGYVILLDAHSIRSEVPRFFDGRLPDLNLGTADGRSCALELAERAFAALRRDAGFTQVLNGRFKGGYITRHYGRPADGVQALQLEIAQSAYMDEAPPYAWEPGRALPLISVLRRFVDALTAWHPQRR